MKKTRSRPCHAKFYCVYQKELKEGDKFESKRICRYWYGFQAKIVNKLTTANWLCNQQWNNNTIEADLVRKGLLIEVIK